MIPMVHMILKWEKELEQPNRPCIQYQIFSHWLKTKEEKLPERENTKRVKNQKQCDVANLVECQCTASSIGIS